MNNKKLRINLQAGQLFNVAVQDFVSERSRISAAFYFVETGFAIRSERCALKVVQHELELKNELQAYLHPSGCIRVKSKVTILAAARL